MLLSLIPLTSAALDDEFEGFETLEEVPFEFELEPGDLPWEQLGTATLAASDIPVCISPALAEARGHVNRLYLQEPDDYTVMFQNRDGSKTIYVFSYPVKSTGMSMNTAATIQVNGSAISFASGNIITSRIGVDLFDYNIGYCEVQTFFGGLLTADGVNITEDARGWARSESSAGNLVYNMSGAAAAEYNMNISATANATLVPGITITPIDPTPSGGITVMAITYSELAGLMSFKSVSNNQYLTLTTSSTPSLTTSASLIVKYSQWIVQFDATFGYILANASNVPNTFIGTTSGQNVLSIGSISELSCVFGLTIVSSGDSTVTIGYDNLALDPLLSIYENNPEDDAFPTACEWRIVNHHSVVLVSGINSTSSTRIEQSGVAFMFGYTFSGQSPTYYDIDLCSASNDQPFTKFYEDDEYWCTINTPGVYSVYYKDSVTGVSSENFLLIVQSSLPSFEEKKTYSIRPVNAPTYYLSMSGSSVERTGYNSLVVSEMSYILNEGIQTSVEYSNSYQFIDVRYERWNTVSRLFRFDAVPNMESIYMISAILSTSQATRPNVSIDGADYDGDLYNLRDDTAVPNTVNYSGTTPQTKVYSDADPNTYIIPCNMGSYYVLVCLNSFDSTTGTVKALKHVSNGVELSTYSVSDTSLRWYVDHVGVDAPLIMQTRNYYCGYTNVLQILHGSDYESIVPGNDLNEKIEYIANLYGTPTSMAGSESVYSNILSKLVTNTSLTASRDSINHPWHTHSISQEDMRDKIKDSLDLGWAPMILSFAGNVPFKQAYLNKDNEVTGHYIVVIGYDEASDCVIISNCHYADKATGTENQRMFGIFAIPAADFYKAVAYLYTMS